MLSRDLSQTGGSFLVAKGFALSIVVFIGVLYVAASVAGAGIGVAGAIEIGLLLFTTVAILVRPPLLYKSISCHAVPRQVLLCYAMPCAYLESHHV